MTLGRTALHLLMTGRRMRSVFPEASLRAIEEAIAAAEASHCGEMCFAVEGALTGAQLVAGVTARARALEVFSQLRVWDTEHSNGVLIYLLLADRAVEIVADRHIHARAGGQAWAQIARGMETRFRQGAFSEGVLEGIAAVAAQLAAHFPVEGVRPDEIANRPVLLG